MPKDKKKKRVVEQEIEEEEQNIDNDQHVIKPSENPGSLNSQDWPLLLKNYHKMNVLSNHYTPIPSGSTPLKRPLK